MFSYETGVTIAFMMFLASTVHTIIMLNSLLEKNLNKIGLRLSRITLTPKELDAEFKNRAFYVKVLFWFLFFAISMFGILLGWVYVLWTIGAFMYARIKDSGAPISIREYRWKLKNVDMSFDEIIQEIAKANEKNATEVDVLKKSIIGAMRERGLN